MIQINKEETILKRGFFLADVTKNIITIDTQAQLDVRIALMYRNFGYKLITLNYNEYAMLTKKRREKHLIETIQPKRAFKSGKCIIRIVANKTQLDSEFYEFYGTVISLITKETKSTSDISEAPSFFCI